jgi:hypothetical protein
MRPGRTLLDDVSEWPIPIQPHLGHISDTSRTHLGHILEWPSSLFGRNTDDAPPTARDGHNSPEQDC